MKTSADLGGCYPPRPSASVDNTILDLQNSSYPTQPHSIIAKYMYIVFESFSYDKLYFFNSFGFNELKTRTKSLF